MVSAAHAPVRPTSSTPTSQGNRPGSVNSRVPARLPGVMQRARSRTRHIHGASAAPDSRRWQVSSAPPSWSATEPAGSPEGRVRPARWPVIDSLPDRHPRPRPSRVSSSRRTSSRRDGPCLPQPTRWALSLLRVGAPPLAPAETAGRPAAKESSPRMQPPRLATDSTQRWSSGGSLLVTVGRPRGGNAVKRWEDEPFGSVAA